MTLEQVNPDLLYALYWLSPYVGRLVGCVVAVVATGCVCRLLVVWAAYNRD